MTLKTCSCGLVVTTKNALQVGTVKAGKRLTRWSIDGAEFLIFNCLCGSTCTYSAKGQGLNMLKKPTNLTREAYLVGQLDYEILKFGNSVRAEKIRAALKIVRKALSKSKAAVLALALVFTAACNDTGSAPSQSIPVASPIAGPTPSPTAAPTPSPTPGPSNIALTYYALALTDAPVGGYSSHVITRIGYCVVYLAKTYCWDDGIKTVTLLIGGIAHYYKYTYWGIGTTVTRSTPGLCSGDCFTSSMIAPTLIGATLDSAIGWTAINLVFTTGGANSVNCTEAGGVLSCGVFNIDLNQVPL